MNRENYDPRILDLFEILGSFICDVFYNDLYLKSRDLVKLGRASSITDAYKSIVVGYMMGVKKPELYSQVVQSIHSYFQKITIYSSITFADFEDKVLTAFIPMQYYRDYTNRDKDANLCRVITRLIEEFSEHVLQQKILRAIIDNHSNPVNVEMLQDTTVDILKLIRDEFYVLFAKKLNARSAKVPEEIVKKLKEQLVEEVRKKCDIQNERDRLLDIVDQLVKKIDLQGNEIAKRDTEIVRRDTELARLRSMPTTPQSYSQPVSNQKRVGTPQTPRDNVYEQAVIRAAAQYQPDQSQRDDIADTNTDITNDVANDTHDQTGDDDDDEEIDEEQQRRERAEQIAKRRAARDDAYRTPDTKSPVQKSAQPASLNNIADDLLDDPGFGLG